MALSMDRKFFASERKRLKMTQEAMAEVLSQNIYTIKKWEGGLRKIPPYMGYVLAAIEAGLEPIGKDHLVEYAQLKAGGAQADDGDDE
ncbi:hypothetical protein ELG63_36485 [Rhizobium leguminosarum]|uniref:hypothetical protein n=1 Tax=Rhizobium leguminosarum TaxID=384 RepID=UPI0010308B04|nr:hypothetical protein [Rhizobium leguminosarum]TBH28188.1 hypothetical protein ELG63_36485 [Rhizobium leguminosarum]